MHVAGTKMNSPAPLLLAPTQPQATVEINTGMPDVEANREGTSVYYFDDRSKTLYRIGTGLGNSVRGAVQAKASAKEMQVWDLGLFRRTSIAVMGKDDVFVLVDSSRVSFEQK